MDRCVGKRGLEWCVGRYGLLERSAKVVTCFLKAMEGSEKPTNNVIIDMIIEPFVVLRIN